MSESSESLSSRVHVVKRIPLTNGDFALIDQRDFERASCHRWKYHFGYARMLAKVRGGCGEYLHRFILQAPTSIKVCFLNSSKLDCTRNNLQVSAKGSPARGSRTCHHCGFFGEGRLFRKGRNQCKVCRSKQCKATLLKNIEEYRAKKRAYTNTQLQENRARAKAWYQDNKRTAKRRIAKWQRNNPGKRKIYALTQRTRHPEKVRTRSINSLHKRRDLKLNNTVIPVTTDELQSIRASAKGICNYCKTVAKKLTFDHVIPLTKGGSHSKENIVMACVFCNCSKNNRDVKQFKRYLKKILIVTA